MEGTRNERSIIIISSYIIGFVSAFILYNFSEQPVTSESESIAITAAQNPSLPITEDVTKAEIINSEQFALASTDNKNVFFCRDEAVPADYCTAYIFSDELDAATQVLLDNQAVTMYKDLLTDVSWSENGLSIANVISANPQFPWLLVSPDSPIDLQ